MNLKDKDGFNLGQMTFPGAGWEDQLPLHLLFHKTVKESSDELAETEWVIFAGWNLKRIAGAGGKLQTAS